MNLPDVKAQLTTFTKMNSEVKSKVGAVIVDMTVEWLAT